MPEFLPVTYTNSIMYLIFIHLIASKITMNKKIIINGKQLTMHSKTQFSAGLYDMLKTGVLLPLTHTHTHNHFMALLDSVWYYLGKPAQER